MGNEVGEVKKEFSVQLTESLDAVNDGLPMDFNKPLFVNNCTALLNGNESLLKFANSCKTGVAQIKQGMVRGAFLGLDFMSKEAYLIPYGNKLDFTISYSGAKKLAKKYAVTPIKDIYADVIRNGDSIDYGVKDNKRYLEFKPKALNEGEIIGAYAVVTYADDSIGYEVMTKSEIDKCKSASKSGGMVWKLWYGEMAKKTVLKRLVKGVELSFETPEMRKGFEEYEEVEEEVHEVPDIFVESEVVNGEED